jgi:lysophospholipase L1-like esterase
VSGRPLAFLAPIMVAAAVLVAAAAPAAPGESHTAAKRLYIDGDSIAYGTDLYLSRYLRGWVVSSAVDVSRHAYQGAAAIEALESEGALPYVVVVNLGTNDDPRAVRQFGSYVRRVVKAAGPERCVIWATIIRPPYGGVSYDGLNNALFAAAKRWQNFHVYDWRQLARAHPAWFGSDGVHPSLPGYRVRARSLASFIRATC